MLIADLSQIPGRTYPARRRTQSLVGGASPIQAASFSMGHVTLASNLEREFGLSFDVDELMQMENVREICRVVQSKLGKLEAAKVQ
jgi:hypothetical protein